MSLDVLVVDDDFMVASIHRRFVERVPGFRVVGEAHTGADALASVDRLRPDLVLLDVHLPDVSGIEVLRRLRAAGHDVGVLVVTAAREADTVRAAVAGGAAHYLVKPFAPEDLAVRLEAFLRTRQALDGLDDDVDQTELQADIDAVFARPPQGTGPRAPLPKGLSPETADAVLAALAGGAELSATECADAVGVSRVSARRYLEHFATSGRAAVRLRYGTAGRPERRYRLS
ncbi:response regulator [Myceligenerans crystallogenes]|uniref:Transcriptional regulatory protein n=1 Tax=Myceligenerans crystallogenes TaxID=316335 RepID=A0ABN2NI78_9MICO